MELEFMELENEEFAFRHVKGDKVLGEITWTLLGDIMAIEHTYVAEELRGQGAAKKLLDKAADYAREHNYKMEPICSYVVSAFERYDEYNDVKA